MASLVRSYPSSPNKYGASTFKFTTHVTSNLETGDGIDDGKTQYIPPAKLRDYWGRGQIQEVLDEHGLTVSVKAIQNQYLRVFSILVYIDEVGCLNSAFTEHDLNDGTFPRDECPWPSAPALLDLWKHFAHYQWMFFPLELHPDHLLGTRVAPKRILPWKKQDLRGGDMSKVYKIEIHESCNMLHQSRQDQTRSKPSTLALKTYTKRGVHLYEKERKALEVLCTNPSEHVVAYYGSFQQMDTYHLILALANGGDLLEYLRGTQPPRTIEDIRDFWNSLSDTLKGLFRVHQATEREEYASKSHTVIIVHEDLKPENILLDRPDHSNSLYVFRPKIADFGCSDVRNVPLDAQDEKPSIDHHGSPTYSAPETAHYAPFMHVGQYRMSKAADIWAIGCIFSEAAVWVALGPNGRHDYGQLREAETRRISSFAGSAYEKCFHNGIEPLRAINEMHQRAIEALPSCDNVTEAILLVVQQHMLTQDLGERWPADKLRTKIGHILDSYHQSTDTRPLPTTANGYISISPPGQSLQTNSLALVNLPLSVPSKGVPSTSSTNSLYLQTSTSSISRNNYATNTIALPLRLPSSSPNSSAPKPAAYPPTGPGSSGRLYPPSGGTTLPQLDTKMLASKSNELATHHSLSVREVYGYREARKKGNHVDLRVAHLVKELGSSLQSRDHLFFFDNSQSMGQHFDEAICAFTALSYLAKQIDTNGIELVLASEPSKAYAHAHTTPLIKKLEERRFSYLNMMESNFGEFVDTVVMPRLPRSKGTVSAARKSGRRVSFGAGNKPLSILVLTDAQWGSGLPQAAGVENPIRRLMKNIVQRDLNRTHIMIQFVRFGNDMDGKRYLQYLDDDIGRQEQCDIVDTEPIDGNVLKMFIGSIDAGTDNTVGYSTASTTS